MPSRGYLLYTPIELQTSFSCAAPIGPDCGTRPKLATKSEVFRNRLAIMGFYPVKNHVEKKAGPTL